MKSSTSRRSSRGTGRLLHSAGWAGGARSRLESWIRSGKGRDLPVAFDFDHTILCGDVGEAVLARLSVDGLLPGCPGPGEVAKPSAERAGGAHAVQVYESVLAVKAEAMDRSPLATGYVWAATAMAGRVVSDVAQATRRVWQESRSGSLPWIRDGSGQPLFVVPFPYPEMLELLGLLIRTGFRVHVISASNVWTVRWTILNVINPLLCSEHGCTEGIRPERVWGVSMLMRDAAGVLHKDRVLVQTRPDYARMEPGTLAGLQLTGTLEHPVPVYAGKVACAWEAFGQRPYLAAGDSPGDHALLDFAQHRLWIGRLEKPELRLSTLARVPRAERSKWTVQSVRSSGDDPRFV